MQKYIRDGKVAIVYSKGYGAGWSSWSPGEVREGMMLDARIVEALLLLGEDAAKTAAAELYPEAYVSRQDLSIEWLDVGTAFRISEYDGWEEVQTLEDAGFIVA